MLTDKCKIDFEKWFIEEDKDNPIKSWISEDFGLVYLQTPFNKLPDSMKIGVYIDFFDSLGIVIDVGPKSYEKTRIGDGFDWWISKESGSVNDFTPRTRQEARNEAIIKANNIYNENTSNTSIR